MSVFTSQVTIDRPVEQVYNLLADMNNHKQLMPENILDWGSTYNTATFNAQNLAKLSLKVGQRVENKSITIIPAEKPPFDLELKWELSSIDNQTGVLYTITADLNMMLKMVASGPLQKLADHETQSLGDILS